MNKLGEGSFGSVYKDGNSALKKFRETDRGGNQRSNFMLQDIMIQEIIILNYLKRSPYIVQMRDFSLDRFEIKLDLYDMSLTAALKRYKFTYDDCMKVFRDILKGVSHMHSLDIIHCDLKHSNILLTLNPLSAVVSDPGIASLGKYSRFNQTPKGYRRPDELLVHAKEHKEKHDYYSLSILGTEMFGNIWFTRTVSPEKLRSTIRELKLPEEITLVLLELSRINSMIYPSIRIILKKLFNDDAILSMPVIDYSPNTLSEYTDKYLLDTTTNLATKSGIEKHERAYQMLKERFNNKNYPPVSLNEYTLYIACSILILSIIFGRQGFDYDCIKKATANKWNTEDINRVITDLISKQNLMDIIMIAE